MADMNINARLAGFFKKDMKLKLIVGVGILGMLLILFSYFNDSGDNVPENPPNSLTATYTSEEYAGKLEKKLSDLVAQIDGVGRNEIMVTIESGVEYVYAQEEKRETDKTGTEAVTENIEQSFILVDSEYGRKEALVLTEKEPKIMGVVIVCEGADNAIVEQELTSVVTTALGITSARVCVVKISDER